MKQKVTFKSLKQKIKSLKSEAQAQKHLLEECRGIIEFLNNNEIDYDEKYTEEGLITLEKNISAHLATTGINSGKYPT